MDLELSVRSDEARDFEIEEETSEAKKGKTVPEEKPAKQAETATATSAAAAPSRRETEPRRPRRRRRRGGVHYPQQSFLWPGPSYDRRMEYRRFSPVRTVRPRAEPPAETVTRECGPCKKVQEELAAEKKAGMKMSTAIAKLTKELVDERAKSAATMSELAAAKETGSGMGHRERMSWSHQLLLLKSGMRALEGREAYHQKMQGLQSAEKNILEQRVRSLDLELMRTRDTFRKAVTHTVTCTGPNCRDACHKLRWGEDE